ncbi:hypothetical protein KIW84_035421 [Lathyrus oleraceus]|uniref:Protein kinase domain-containing protein n=1 Tax=Pisum sativum TaxID=3888 RepID=A0A9D5B6N3_PEA|nr:hypothetical protein KIW84_035421 [Pisum sativum]
MNFPLQDALHYLESLRSSHPELGEWYNSLASAYSQARIVRRSGRFPLCKEVAHYYGHGVLHHNLKPQNLLLDYPYYDGHGKLTFSRNEVECEQLVRIPKGAGQSVPFNVYVWHKRNNSYLVACRTEKSLPVEAVTYVPDCDLYKGRRRYYQRLGARYDARNLGVRVGENSNKEALGTYSTR